MKFSHLLFAAAALGSTAIASTASAQTTFDFANLKYSNSTSSGFLPTNIGTNVVCTGGDKCSAVGGPLTFQKLDPFANLITVSAYGFYNGNNAIVVQDHDNGYVAGGRGAGLGVYKNLSDNSDDNITFGEMLKLSFNQTVSLTTLGLRAEGHNFTNWTNNAVFSYSTNGINWTTALLPKGTGTFVFNQTSNDFYFRFADGNRNADQYYISSAVVVATVPEPSTYALLGVGLLALGVVARRRKYQNS